MIKTFVVHSSFESAEQIKKRLHDELSLFDSYTSLLPAEFVCNLEQANQLEEPDEAYKGIIILTATGGTEQIIDLIITRSKLPVLILANFQKNSLAASIEVYSHLNKSYPLELIVYENIIELTETIDNFALVCRALIKINKARLGLIGTPSDWLLSSRNINSLGNFKTELVSIETSELTSLVNTMNDAEITGTVSKIKSDYKTIEVSDKSLNDSLKVYRAIDKIIDKHQFNAFTIRCFDLLDYGYTSCMALSMKNDEGIIAGCEGDIPSAFSMMIGTYLTDEPCWMANPARIGKSDNTLLLAHCTIPSKMISDLSKASLTTHMESGLSTANRGPLYHKQVTIFRINSSFDEIVCITGRIIDSNRYDEKLCRTQVTIQLNGPVTEWIKSVPGNHQIMVYGNILSRLQMFTRYSGLKLINIH